MKKPAVYRQFEEGCPISLEMLGRLRRGDEQALAAVLPDLTEQQRAQLAIFCNSRQHLRELRLQVAAVCEEHSLVRLAGSAGSVLFSQARGTERRQEPATVPAVPGHHKVSLAQLA
jgi:hypothetical protein